MAKVATAVFANRMLEMIARQSPSNCGVAFVLLPDDNAIFDYYVYVAQCAYVFQRVLTHGY